LSMASVEAAEGPMCRRGKVSSSSTGFADSVCCGGVSKTSSATSATAAACCAVEACCWNARFWRNAWLVQAIARGEHPASCGRESWAVHVERASLLAEEAALRQAVRILARKQTQCHTRCIFKVCFLPSWGRVTI
jgi:hypothetical protein